LLISKKCRVVSWLQLQISTWKWVQNQICDNFISLAMMILQEAVGPKG